MSEPEQAAARDDQQCGQSNQQPDDHSARHMNEPTWFVPCWLLKPKAAEQKQQANRHKQQFHASLYPSCLHPVQVDVYKTPATGRE